MSAAPRLAAGVVDYLNARPLVFGLVEGLAAERIELVHAVPSELARRMGDGTLDLALLPVIELARLPGLEIVPGLAIGTRGPAASVLLVSRVPPERVRTLALDPESRTSNVLAQLLLARAWRASFRCVDGARDLEASLREADAVVRIGDKALFEAVPAGCQAFDLGAAWTEWTGLPFVFAAWIARPGVVDGELYRLLHESRRRGTRQIERIANEYVWDGATHPEISRRYLERNIVFRLGAAELDALRTFFARASAAGLIEAAPELRLALGARSACHAAVAEARHG